MRGPSTVSLGIVTVLLVGCGPDEPTSWAPASEPSWVGSAGCAECHVDVAEAWSGTAHDKAMQAAAPDTVLGDFDGATFEGDDGLVRFERRDDEYVVVAAGAEGESAERTVAYTFGAEPLQQLLLAGPGGRLQAFGVAWDSRPAAEGGQAWFDLHPERQLAPGDPLHWTGREQTWNFMCAECHSTGVRKAYDAALDRYDTTFEEVDVACEACHGPGSGHLEWLDAGEPAEHAASGFVVDLQRPAGSWRIEPGATTATRAPERFDQVEVDGCGRCHARRTPIVDEARYDRPLADSYRIALLDARMYHADGQPRDETYVYGSFLQSREYAAGVSCSDCHEPHGLELVREGNALCAGCHLESTYDTPDHTLHEIGASGSACVDCHMPATDVMVVDRRREHAFRVPRPDLAASHGTPDACSACHANRGAEWAADVLADRFGPPRRGADWTGVLAAGRAGDPGAGAALAQLGGDWSRPGIVRATALSLLEGYPSESSYQALRLALQNEDPLVRLGALMALDQADDATRLELAYPLLRDSIRSVRLQAARVLAAVSVRDLPAEQSERILGRVDELEAALRVLSDRSESRAALGVLLARTGRTDEAEAEYRAAIRLAPESVPARVNLADLYRLGGREAEAEALLEETVEIAPDSAPAWHSLGLARARRGRPQQAIDPLGRAAALAPSNPRFALAFAVSLREAGRLDDAYAELTRAWRRAPASVPLLAALVELERSRSGPRAALEWAERIRALAPGDPGAARMVEELRAELAGEGAR